MKGFVESIVPDQVRGWAYEPANPDAHVTVLAVLAGQEVGRTVANMQRHDLVTAGIGRGDHGFAIEMPPLVFEADRQNVEVFALSGDERIPLAAHTPRSDAALDLASDPRVAVVDAAQHPVFVLGPARSGTSAVALALLQSRRYEGFGEGHLMPLALTLLQSASDYYKRFGGAERRDTLIGAVPARVFERMIRRGFTQMTRGKFPSGYWLDKSPTVEMVLAAPLMRELYPDAKFLFMKRRVVENFASRRRKFPRDRPQDHYMDWENVLRAWLDIRPQLNGSYLEVEHLELARRPEAIAAEISAFLKMPEENIERFTASLVGEHPEQTAGQIGEIVDVKTLGLSDAELAALTRACAATMLAYGYDFSMNYYRADTQSKA